MQELLANLRSRSQNINNEANFPLKTIREGPYVYAWCTNVTSHQSSKKICWSILGLRSKHLPVSDPSQQTITFLPKRKGSLITWEVSPHVPGGNLQCNSRDVNLALNWGENVSSNIWWLEFYLWRSDCSMDLYYFFGIADMPCFWAVFLIPLRPVTRTVPKEDAKLKLFTNLRKTFSECQQRGRLFHKKRREGVGVANAKTHVGDSAGFSQIDCNCRK